MQNCNLKEAKMLHFSKDVVTNSQTVCVHEKLSIFLPLFCFPFTIKQINKHRCFSYRKPNKTRYVITHLFDVFAKHIKNCYPGKYF